MHKMQIYLEPLECIQTNSKSLIQQLELSFCFTDIKYFSLLDIIHQQIIACQQGKDQLSMSSDSNLTSTLNSDQQVGERIFFSLLQKAGSFGRYQKRLIILWCIVGYLSGGFQLMVPFLYYQDPYVCPQSFGGQNCQEYVCSLSSSHRFQYIPQKTMSTLSNKYGDFRCPNQKLEIDALITLTYIGAIVGSFINSFIGDLVGRKSLLIISMVFTVFGLIVVIFSQSLIVAGAGSFLVSIGVQNAFNICFYFIAETITEQFREKASVAFQLFYSLGALLNGPWYYFLRDWQMVLTIFYFIPAVITLVAVFIIVKDTPICLVMRNSPSKALEDFSYIAEINNQTTFSMNEEEIKNIKQLYQRGENGSQKKRRFSIIDLFRFKSLRGITFILTLLQCTIIFSFYAPALMLDKFKLNIFVNGLVVSFSELISYPITYYMIMKSRRKYVAYTCFGISSICALILVFIWDQSEENPTLGNSIAVLILIFVFRFVVTLQYTFFCVYLNELYPTQIRVLGTSLVELMGSLMVSSAPEILDGCLNSGFPVMVLFCTLTMLSIIFSKQLPQTLHKIPPQIIEELKEIAQSALQSDVGIEKVNNQQQNRQMTQGINGLKIN